MSIEKCGRFVWYDLVTAEPKAAKDFYRQLIGWGTQEWDGGGDQPYTMWTNKETPLGGVMELSEEAKAAGAPPHWMAYVEVDDIEQAVSKVKEAGGSVLHEATEVSGAGSFAVLADPQGAAFAIYSSANPESRDSSDKDQIGRFSWNELATSDYKAAFTFYSDLFGWEPQEAMDMGPGGIYQVYGQGGAPLGGMFNKPDEMPGPPMWLYYVSVKDVNVAAQKVTELGGQVLNGPMEVPGGDLIAQCVDPQGALFALHSKS
ncbi:MAG: VOC family protein [Acidobacteriota bacterium]|jgi:predicted enzyme related to lactoylglutathione lyase|nr:VOC family protein [Acidobacteriota bacterium]